MIREQHLSSETCIAILVTTRKMQTKVIRKLLYQRILPSNPVPPSTVAGWFPEDEYLRVRQAIDHMAQNPEAPLQRHQRAESRIHLPSVEAALRFLDNHDSSVPTGLDAFVQTPTQ